MRTGSINCSKTLAWNLALIAIAIGQFDIEARNVVRRQRNLGVDRRFAQCLHSAWMLAQIDTVLRVNLIERNRDQQVVDVVAAKVRVAVGRLHFEDAIAAA